VASTGFGRASDAYERGRPSYPSEAIDWLAQELALDASSVVVDVGAGTGKLTQALMGTGAQVIAVEPVAGMRETLAQRLPDVTVSEGRADAMSLDDASADAVVAGQAYHWFAGAPALTEFHRVLRVEGHLGLIWNISADRPLWREVSKIINPYRGDVPRHQSGGWRASLQDTDLFSAPVERHFSHRQPISRDGLLDRVGSISFVAALEPSRREPLLEQIAALAARESEPLELEYRTEVYVFERLALGGRRAQTIRL
jgi:SAM-dependent methyltransferase